MGFIDKTGAWVIPPQYARVDPFSGGLAAVRDVDYNLLSYIDTSGKTVWTRP